MGRGGDAGSSMAARLCPAAREHNAAGMERASTSSRLLRGLALAAVVLLSSSMALPARAGPWEAGTAQGLTVRIVQDLFHSRDGYVLERAYPDGSIDAGFGEQGRLTFTLGPDNEGPAALRVDTLGRPWIAGASAGRGDRLQAVVLRFLASGAPDVAYAEGGRSATAPAGRPARALDLAPLADGSAFVAGLVSDRQGQERAGWWRLAPDGRVDPRFGLGGLWVDGSEGSSEVLGLTLGGDGSVALALRRGEGAAARYEAWLLAPGESQPRLGESAPAALPRTLRWQAGQWQWSGGDNAALRMAPAPDPALHQPGAADPAPIRRGDAPSQVPRTSPLPEPGGVLSRSQVLWAAVAVTALAALVLGWRLREQRRKRK